MCLRCSVCSACLECSVCLGRSWSVVCVCLTSLPYNRTIHTMSCIYNVKTIDIVSLLASRH